MNIPSKIFAFFLLVALLPLFFIIIICSFIFQGTPIFFIQERVGFKNSLFNIYKFRTMIKNNSMDRIAGLNDDRITKWGKILRNYKLDELPQLINIIKGEMVFVGPRPEIPDYFDAKQSQFLNDLKPGLSDFASILLRNEDIVLNQINGLDPYRELIPLKCALSNYYLKKKGYFTDIKIIVFTILVIFFPIKINKFFLILRLKTELPEWSRFIDKYCNK